MQPEPQYFKNQKQWRKWLEKNASKEKEIWLLHYKKHTGKPGVSYQEALEEAICFGWIDGILRRIDGKKHMIRYSPRRKKSVWSLRNKKIAEELIKQGKMTLAGFSTIKEAKKSGMWQKAYTNIRKERMPTDLKKALMSNKKAWGNFNKFANSYRNMYIGWIKSSKTEPTRKKRIDEVVKLSALNKKSRIA